MRFGVTYQTSKQVGNLYMPVGPDRYEIVEINAGMSRYCNLKAKGSVHNSFHTTAPVLDH